MRAELFPMWAHRFSSQYEVQMCPSSFSLLLGLKETSPIQYFWLFPVLLNPPQSCMSPSQGLLPFPQSLILYNSPILATCLLDSWFLHWSFGPWFLSPLPLHFLSLSISLSLLMAQISLLVLFNLDPSWCSPHIYNQPSQPDLRSVIEGRRQKHLVTSTAIFTSDSIHTG